MFICRHVGDDKGRTHELEQSAVKCMRGILFCYMRQAEKVILLQEIFCIVFNSALPAWHKLLLFCRQMSLSI